MNLFRKPWKSIFKHSWVFGIFLILLFGIPRFILVLQTNISGGYGFVSFIFVLMWFTPFIFMTKEGRRVIRLKRPNQVYKVIVSFLTGAIFCTAMYIIFTFLFDLSYNNAYAYIAKSYTLPTEVLVNQRFRFFMMFSLTSMVFSPIGEELFYRGVVHNSFRTRLGDKGASIVDGLAFAVTHLAHFGIVYLSGIWHFLPIPALLWVFFMFTLSLILNFCKKYTDSLWGAVIAHGGFNVAMTYFIFYHIL